MDNFQVNFSPDLLFPQNETPFTQIPNNISSDFGQYPRPQQPFAGVAEFQQGPESSVGPVRSRKISRDARNEKKIMAEQNRRDATRSNTNVLRNKLPRSYERDATSDPKVLEKGESSLIRNVFTDILFN